MDFKITMFASSEHSYKNIRVLNSSFRSNLSACFLGVLCALWYSFCKFLMNNFEEIFELFPVSKYANLLDLHNLHKYARIIIWPLIDAWCRAWWSKAKTIRFKYFFRWENVKKARKLEFKALKNMYHSFQMTLNVSEHSKQEKL